MAATSAGAGGPDSLQVMASGFAKLMGELHSIKFQPCIKNVWMA